MPSPTCTVNGAGTANGVTVNPGILVTIQLADLTVNSWALTVTGTDEISTAPVFSINQGTRTATFTSAGAGSAVGIKSVVNGGINAQGVVDPTLTTTFGIYTLATVSQGRVIFAGEGLESSVKAGWLSTVNPVLRSAGFPAGISAGSFTHGLDSARPVASGLIIGRQYYGDDSGILYECISAPTGSSTGWTVVNIGSDMAVMGPFSDANYITSLPVAGGPSGISPCTFAIEFVTATNPGVSGKCLWSHTNAAMTSGWGIFASATAANTLALKVSIAGVLTVVELPGAAIGFTGQPYCLALAIDTGSPHAVRYAFNGTLQTATSVAGVYTAPISTDVNMIGRFAGAGLPCDFASISWAQTFNSALVNADLVALSNNIANWTPGMVTATPNTNWQARWYAAGAQAFMPTGPNGIYMTTAGNFQKVAQVIYAP